jgi:hypothetical protein
MTAEEEGDENEEIIETTPTKTTIPPTQQTARFSAGIRRPSHYALPTNYGQSRLVAGAKLKTSNVPVRSFLCLARV